MKNNISPHDWRYIFVSALFVGGIVSIFSSSAPDGLEATALMHGLSVKDSTSFAGILQGYSFPGINNSLFATSITGIIGACVVFVILAFIGKTLYRFETPSSKTIKPVSIQKQ